MDSGFQVLDSRFFVSGAWIPDSNHGGIPDSKDQNSTFHKQKLHGLAFLYSLCLTLCKTDITLRGTLIAGPKSLRIRES